MNMNKKNSKKSKVKNKRVKSYIVNVDLQVKASCPENAESNVRRVIKKWDIPHTWSVFYISCTMEYINSDF